MAAARLGPPLLPQSLLHVVTVVDGGGEPSQRGHPSALPPSAVLRGARGLEGGGVDGGWSADSAGGMTHRCYPRGLIMLPAGIFVVVVPVSFRPCSMWWPARTMSPRFRVHWWLATRAGACLPSRRNRGARPMAQPGHRGLCGAVAGRWLVGRRRCPRGGPAHVTHPATSGRGGGRGRGVGGGGVAGAGCFCCCHVWE